MAAAGKCFRRSVLRNFKTSIAASGMQESHVVRRRSSSSRSSSSSGFYYLIFGFKSSGRFLSISKVLLIVGLGNYSMPETRHSIGMTAVNHLADKLGVKFKYDKKLSGYYGITQVDGLDVILLRPKLLMNINGRSIAKVASAYKIEPRNVILVHDDLDRVVGRYSIKYGGSAGGHNGVKSAIGSLMSCEMERFVIGIGRPKHKSEVIDYVLQKFTPTENEVVKHIVDECSDAIIEHLKSRKPNETTSTCTKEENTRGKKGRT